MNLTASIKSQAKALGFDAIAVTAATLPESAGAGLREFLANGHHGQMSWMEDKLERRIDPGIIWPEAKSIIMLGVNYGPTYDPMGKLADKSTGNISCYAQGDDYHDVIKKRLKQLARWMVFELGGDVKVFVDTAPVMEKSLAAQAGIGWQGKHTCVVSREFGSWLFLGSVFTTLELTPDTPESDHCGSCRQCIDICPTQAFTGPRKLDARKCISYLTIEHKGEIPHEYRRAMGNRIYGCDDCLAVCPWNKFASESKEMKFAAREALIAPALAELAELDDSNFRSMFSKSPIKRIGRESFIRNVMIAIGNSGDRALIPIAKKLTTDESPVIAEAARWALHELAPASL